MQAIKYKILLLSSNSNVRSKKNIFVHFIPVFFFRFKSRLRLNETHLSETIWTTRGKKMR